MCVCAQFVLNDLEFEVESADNTKHPKTIRSVKNHDPKKSHKNNEVSYITLSGGAKCMSRIVGAILDMV